MNSKDIRVPLYIKRKMHQLAKLGAEIKQLDAELDEWFNSHGYETEAFSKHSLRSDNGISLSELSDGNDITDEFIEAIEAGQFEDARKEL